MANANQNRPQLRVVNLAVEIVAVPFHKRSWAAPRWNWARRRLMAPPHSEPWPGKSDQQRSAALRHRCPAPAPPTTTNSPIRSTRKTRLRRRVANGGAQPPRALSISGCLARRISLRRYRSSQRSDAATPHAPKQHVATGELLRQLTLDPTRTYQPTGAKQGGPKRPYGPHKKPHPRNK